MPLPICDASCTLDLRSGPDRDALVNCESGEARLIHSRGTGVQRRIVQSLLAHHPRVAAFFDAPPDLGAWGATIVRLKP